jgi:signal peptidase I
MKELWEWGKTFVIAIGLAVLIRAFIFAPIIVEGESMQPTLHDGDRMIVSKINYVLGEPDRFDIVVFEATEDKDYIKRIIGLPGDMLEYKNNTLFVNGEKVNESYLPEQMLELTDDFSTEVPSGMLFVLGDNRGNSQDSRMIGPVSIDKVVGEANILFWPIPQFHYFK